MSAPLELPAKKRKHTGNALLSDYPVAPIPNPPIVTFLGYSLPPPRASSSAARQAHEAPPRTELHPPNHNNNSSNNNAFTWSFLSHPILQHLRRWPGLNSGDAALAAVQSQSAPTPATSLVLETTRSLDLVTVLSIPPVAAALASNLYGHDLLSLRLLNSTFLSVLSSTTSESGRRPYYHTLLLKSMLCPRTDTSSEPVGSPCKSAGGNVGPCMLCPTIICGTCVSPEIWTNRRYRYLCPTCCTLSPASATTCRCQSHLWMCRPCYKTHWVEDLDYDAAGKWFSPAALASCHRCGSTHTNKTDPRLPVQQGRRFEFREWFVKEHKRRPVACGWCGLRVASAGENWGLRPLAIRRGEERGRMWLMEMETRRREREGDATTTTGEDR